MNLAPDGGRLSALHRARVAIANILHGSSFRRNVSVLFFSSLFAQFLSLAASPILTRIYDPAQFGTLGVYAALLTVLVVVAALRYDMAIPIAASDREATDLLMLCGLVLAVTAVLVGLAMDFSPISLLTRIGLKSLVRYRHFVPVGFGLLGAYGVLVAFATREASFDLIARTRVSQALTGPATQIGLGLAGFGTPGLIIGFIVAQSAGLMVLSRHTLGRCETPLISLRRMCTAAHRYRNFPLVSTWGALAEAIGGTLLLYLLCGLYYSAAVTGFLFLAERVIGRPLRLVVSSLWPVMFREAGKSARHDPAHLRKRYLQVSLRQACFAAVWILSADCAAAWLFPLLFGPKWGNAAPYVWVVSPWYFCATVARSVGPTLLVLERQGLNAVPQIAGPACGAIAFVICGNHGLAAPRAMLGYSVCQAVSFVWVYVAALVAIGKLAQHLPSPSADQRAK